MFLISDNKMILSLENKIQIYETFIQAIHKKKKKNKLLFHLAFAASSKATLIIDPVDPSTS